MDSNLICPKCMKSFDDCEDYSSYHNRVRYICPHCGYDGDSIEFETSYEWHPIHTITDNGRRNDLGNDILVG